MNNTAQAVRSEPAATYAVSCLADAAGLEVHNDLIIARALEILRERLHKPGAVLESPEAVRDYLRLRLAAEKSERFGCLFLDGRHRVISYDVLFQGSIDGAAVYPREVVKAALARNASAVMLVHNHPSGYVEPSQADRQLTVRLKEALELVDVRVLDHFIVGGAGRADVLSFAERGYL